MARTAQQQWQELCVGEFSSRNQPIPNARELKKRQKNSARK